MTSLSSLPKALAKSEISKMFKEESRSLLKKHQKGEGRLLHLEEDALLEIILKPDDTFVVIMLKADVQAEVILKLHPDLESCDVDAFLPEGAKLRCKVVQEGVVKQRKVKQRSFVEAKASMHWHNVTFINGDVEQELISEVCGEDSESSLDWVFHATGADSYQLSASTIYHAPKGRGEMKMRGVAEQKAKVQCNGKLEIGSNGNGTNTYLTEDILMLDKTTRVDAVPALEIKANDVKASHKAGVRNVTKEEVFYFATRGISEEKARKMYVEGFLN